ncbi:hypothetical protein KI387_038360 [Taxus chinensis]|uniref:PGG domain-containing protein n=1 Tax=Taxus chinensis TaxID=29808 RepID=A0AA38CD55_TAXCH|nr:hypothetical protein KI387_038360 [Taxus chinensis]
MGESVELEIVKGMDTRLYKAAEVGDVYVLNRLVKGNLKVLQEVTPLGNTALHIAASHGDLLFVEKLLQLVKQDLVVGREFISATDLQGNTALHVAAFHGRHKLVQRLLQLVERDLEAGGFLSAANSDGNTALHEAAKGGSYKVVEVLLQQHHNGDRDHGGLARAINHLGETALFTASEEGHTLIVEQLLPFISSDTEMKRVDGQTPLHCAVFKGHLGVVKKLLEHRPELAKQADEFGRTPLHMAALSPPYPTYPILGRNAMTSIYILQIVRLLLKKENSLCYRVDNNKQSPVHMAVKEGKYHLVRIILDHGRDCRELVDQDGRKPLHLAVMTAVQISDISELSPFRNMLFSLMSRGSINHRDNRGLTPLHIAMQNIEKDEILFHSIKEALQINGALLTPKMLEDTREKKRTTGKSQWKAETISINAVLIATVSFAAAFTLPGGLDSNPGDEPVAILIHTVLFKMFVICDAFAFCTSTASAILVHYAGVGKHHDPFQVIYSFYLLWSALISLLAAFGAAIHLVITSAQWLAVIVWVMLSLVPISILVMSSSSKRSIFRPERHKIWFALQFPLGLIVAISLFIFDIINVVVFSGPIYNVAHWVKKIVKR